MHRHVAWPVLGICLWTAVASAATIVTQEHTANDPQHILGQLRRRLEGIANYQCTQLTIAPPRYRRGSSSSAAANIDQKELAYSCQGHGRVRQMYGDLSATSYIWDGTRAIEVRERVRSDGTVVYSESIVPGRHYQIDRNNTPWRYLGGTLIETLAKALEAGTDVRVTQTDAGLCRVDINYPYGSIDSTVLDPARGYLPVTHRVIIRGRGHIREDVDFEEVTPGIWFPVAVWMQDDRSPEASSSPPTPRRRFINIKINDPNFERLLDPALPEGSTVADEVHQIRYVAGRRSAAAPTQPSEPNQGPEAFQAAYRLDADEAVKRVAPPFPSARARFIVDHEPPDALGAQSDQPDRTYIFQWDGRPEPKVCFAGSAFLSLSDILQHVAGLDIAAYDGPEELLNLPLTGDWIVHKNTSPEKRLVDLRQIIREETGLHINFDKQRVDTQVVKVTGTFTYHALSGALQENDVQLFAEGSADELRTYCGGGSGTLNQLLRHLANRTGRRFVAETESSAVRLSWSDYRSAQLDPHDGPRQDYRDDLAQLLKHIAEQTGLTFTLERRKIDGWLVTVAP